MNHNTILTLAALLLATAIAPAPESATTPSPAAPEAKARFIVEPEIFLKHTSERDFIGPGTILLENGDLLMAAPAVAEADGGRLLMLARTGSGSLHVSWSSDGGDTWSEPQPTTLISACSSLTLKPLPDGRLIVFYNHATPLKQGAFFPRTPLCYAVSDDAGKNWGQPVIVDAEGMEKKDRQNIYPSIAFTKEGMLVMWSNHQADPKGNFGKGDANIGGGKRAILAYPEACQRSDSLPKAANIRGL